MPFLERQRQARGAVEKTFAPVVAASVDEAVAGEGWGSLVKSVWAQPWTTWMLVGSLERNAMEAGCLEGLSGRTVDLSSSLGYDREISAPWMTDSTKDNDDEVLYLVVGLDAVLHRVSCSLRRTLLLHSLEGG